MQRNFQTCDSKYLEILPTFWLPQKFDKITLLTKNNLYLYLDTFFQLFNAIFGRESFKNLVRPVKMIRTQ